MQKYLQNCFFESIFPSNHTFESAHKQRRGCIFTNLSTAMRANVLTDEHTETCWINGVALHITAPNRHPERDKKNVSFWSRFVFLSKERRQVLVEGNMCDFHYSVQSGFIFFCNTFLNFVDTRLFAMGWRPSSVFFSRSTGPILTKFGM